MLGGIDNNLFLSGFGGFIVLILIIIPLLRWTFGSPKGVAYKNRDLRHQRAQMRKELRRIKRK